MADNMLVEQINQVYPAGTEPEINRRLQAQANEINRLRAQGDYRSEVQAAAIEKAIQTHFSDTAALEAKFNVEGKQADFPATKRNHALHFLNQIEPTKSWAPASSYQQKSFFKFSFPKLPSWLSLFKTKSAKTTPNKSKWRDTAKEEKELRQQVSNTEKLYKTQQKAQQADVYRNKGNGSFLDRSFYTRTVSEARNKWEQATNKLKNFLSKNEQEAQAAAKTHKGKFGNVMNQLKTERPKLKKVEINAHKKSITTKITEAFANASIKATKLYKAAITSIKTNAQAFKANTAALGKTISSGVSSVKNMGKAAHEQIVKAGQAVKSKVENTVSSMRKK